MKRQLKFAVLLCSMLSFSVSYAWKTVTLTKPSSLGAIAEQYRPQGVKHMDMVIAIRTVNPRVFTNLSNFKPGVKLLIPTNAAEVRLAIKGKYPTLTDVGANVQKNVIASAAPSGPPAVTAASKTVVTKVAAPAKAPTVAGNANKNLAKPLSTGLPVVKTNSAHEKTAAVHSTQASANSTATNNAVSSNNKPVVAAVGTTVTASDPRLVIKTAPTTTATLDLVSGTTMKSLQATVESQTQAIQSYQAQITDLDSQLGTANQQMQALQAQLSGSKIWTVSNLGWVLWALTLGAMWLQARKLKQLAPVEVRDDHDGEEDEQEDEYNAKAHVRRSEEQCEFEYEPQFHEVKNKDKAVLNEAEPQVTKAKSKAGSNQKPNWEQVELDIPAVASTTTEEFLGAELQVDHFEDKELAGEQQDIMSALEKDQDNLDWHKALLEFYIKTNSHNGFKRHYQMMMQTGLMREGDNLWEEVRKMYLNSWIYPGFSS